jgi:hypothetical protein
MDCRFQSVADFRDAGFRFWNGIQAFIGERRQRAVITHDLISRRANTQSKLQLLRYCHLIRNIASAAAGDGAAAA